jgi:RimJ/RimL family protein N-acetyltransferase
VHLETERLLMPPLSSEHTEALAEVYADPEVARYIGGAALDAKGTAAQVHRVEAVWREHGYGQSALIDRASGVLLGRAGPHPWPHWARWSWATSSPGTRRAAASPPKPPTRGSTSYSVNDVVFGELGLHRLTAVIHPDNEPSRALATRLGFHVHRDDVTPTGVPVVVYERLRR